MITRNETDMEFGRHMRPHFLALVFALGSGLGLATYAVKAQTQTNIKLPSGVQFVSSLEGVSEYRLKNGFKVLLIPDASKASITTNLTYLVGSVNENYGETGMAHLLEHLMFKGTPKHPAIPSEMKERGAEFNASTNADRTNYFQTLPATANNLEWSLELEADRMIHSEIAKVDLDSEFSVVRNEFEAGQNNPIGVTFEQTLNAAFDWHNYGKTTIGNKSDIENVPIDKLKAFYKKHYQPDNSVLVAGGKFDPQNALELVKKYFARIPKPKRVLQTNYTVEPSQDGERAIAIRRLGNNGFVIAGYHMPAATHPDAPVLGAISFLLGANPSGQLYEKLVKTSQALQVGGFSQLQKYPTLALFYAVTAKDANLEGVKNTMLETVENFAKKAPTFEELNRYKIQNAKQFSDIQDDSVYITAIMSEYIALGDWRTFFYLRDAYQKITTDDVQRVANTYLRRSNRTVGTFIPSETVDRVTVPSAPNVQELLQNFTTKPLNATAATGESLNLEPLELEKRVERGQLANIKYAFLTKKTNAESINLLILLHWGDVKSVQGRAIAAGFVASLLQTGTLKHTKQQLQDELARLQAEIDVQADSTGGTVRIKTDRKNLNEVLALAREILREPSFPQDEFALLKQQQVADLEEGKLDPQSVAFTAFQRAFNRPDAKFGDHDYVPTLDETIAAFKALKIEDVKAVYTDFWGLSNAEISAIGDFDGKELKTTLSNVFNGWQSKAPYTRIPNPYRSVKPQNIVIKTPDKTNAFFIAGLNLPLRDDNSEYPALSIANYIFGGGAISSRIADRLRQKDGLSYGVGAFINPSSFNEVSNWVSYAIYAPQNVEKLEAAFKEELTKVATEGFTASELEAAKIGFLQSIQTGRSEDQTIVYELLAQSATGRSYQFDHEFETRIKALTVDQVNTAFQKYIKLENLVIVKAGDFK
jgi:zinc protease